MRWAAELIFLAVLAPLASAQDKAALGLTITPTKLDFGTQSVDTTTPPVTISIQNTAASPVTLEEIVPSGIDFLAQNNCGEHLAPGAACTVQIEFKPAEEGVRTGILEIIASDSATPHLIPLNGVGWASVGPERPGAVGSLPSLNSDKDRSPKEEGQTPVKNRGIRPTQRRKHGS